MRYFKQKVGDNTLPPGFVFQFDYDRERIEKIKEIPSSGRKWLKEQKLWWIAPHYEKIVDRILTDAKYDPLNDLYGGNFGEGGANIKQKLYDRMYLKEDAPEVLVRSALKALTSLYHPSGGQRPNQERMIDINLAYEEICKTNGWRK